MMLRFINKYPVVSFDIFDTLILRKVSNPEDIFEIVEKLYNERYGRLGFCFAEKRKIAEHHSRLKSETMERGREITFDEIYSTLQEENRITDEEKTNLSNIECEVELDNCIPNPYMKEIYDKIVFQKKIYIISDIYHCEDFISKILFKCGYRNYKKLYVSSKYRKYKSTGLFNIFLNEQNIDPTTTIHVGDNYLADIEGAKKSKINTYYYEKSINFARKFDDYNQIESSLINIDAIQRSLLLAFIINNLYSFRPIEKSFWYKFGMMYVGIYILGFVQWLKSQWEFNHYGKKLFVLRDGEIINKVFSIIDNDSKDRIQFECSRKALNFIAIEEFDDVFKFYNFNGLSFKEIFCRLKILDLIADSDLLDYNFDSCVKTKNDFECLKKIVSNKFIELKKRVKKDREIFYAYLKELKLDKENYIALVDISWSGTILKRMRRLFELSDGRFSGQIDGYFIGTFHDMSNTYGYLFKNGSSKSTKYINVVTNFFELYDQVFTMNRGSLKNYIYDKDGKVDFEYDDKILISKEVIINIHSGVIDFSQKFYDQYINKGLINSELAISPWYSLITDPTYEQSKEIGSLVYDSIGYGEHAKTKKLAYSGNFLNFISAYKNSYWKVGNYKMSTAFARFMYKIIENKIFLKVKHKFKVGMKKLLKNRNIIKDINDFNIYESFQKICKNNHIYFSEKEMGTSINIFILKNKRNIKYLYDTLDGLTKLRFCKSININISLEKSEIINYKKYENKFKSISIIENKTDNEYSNSFNEISSLKDGYFLLLNRGDFLLSNMIDYCLENNLFETQDVIYFDECEIDVNFNIIKINFKPDFSYELAFSQNYINYACLIKVSKVNEIVLPNIALNSAIMHYIIVSLANSKCHIFHIDQPIYASRNIDGVFSRLIFNENYSIDDSKINIEHFLKNNNQPIVCIDTDKNISGLKINSPLVDKPLVSIVIPFKDQVELLECCLNSILTKTTYQNYEIIGISNNSNEQKTFVSMKRFQQNDSRVRFYEYNIEFNYSKINNYAVNNIAKGDHIILLNNDTKIISPNWIEELLVFSQNHDIGVVGAKMYYEDNTIEHAGIAVGLKGYLSHLHQFFDKNEQGYFGRLSLVQNFSSLMAACMMIKKSLYQELNGLDENNLTIAYNDIDFCLRLYEKGYRNVFTPYCELYHFESKSRGYLDSPEKREREYKELMFTKNLHKDLFRRDPFYNINLPRDRDDFGLK